MISPNLCSTFNGSSPPRLLAQARLTCSVAESSMSNECCIVQPYKKPLQSSRRFQRLPEMPWTASTSDVSLKEMLIRNACTMKSSAAEEEKKRMVQSTTLTFSHSSPCLQHFHYTDCFFPFESCREFEFSHTLQNFRVNVKASSDRRVS